MTDIEILEDINKKLDNLSNLVQLLIQKQKSDIELDKAQKDLEIFKKTKKLES